MLYCSYVAGPRTLKETAVVHAVESPVRSKEPLQPQGLKYFASNEWKSAQAFIKAVALAPTTSVVNNLENS